jgi:prepilin-type N-terminal cleavage/methylation domain-containing protein
MRNYRGFTLVELLVTMVIMAVVGLALTSMLLRSFRVTQSQLQTADMQANMRTSGLVMPLEFREVGYDTNITTGTVTSDLESISATEIQFRAMRGFATTCGTPSLASLQIRKPVYGMRRPTLTDGFLLFVESDPNTRIDDQWIPITVTAVDQTLCGADSAITLTMSTPQVAPGVNLALTQVFVGGPVRYYERMRFGPFVDTDGRTYLGARSVSAGEANYRAVAGPINEATGLSFRYFDRNEAVLDPTTAAPARVRVVEINLQGQSQQAINLAGAANRQRGAMITQTRVALRNTLTH